MQRESPSELKPCFGGQTAHLLTPLEEMAASGGGSDPQHTAEPDESSGFLYYSLGSCALLNPSIPCPNSSPAPSQAGTLGFHG